MSHAEFDRLDDLKRRISAADREIAAAKGAGVVDIRAFAEMKRRREVLVTEALKAETIAQ